MGDFLLDLYLLVAILILVWRMEKLEDRVYGRKQ